MTKPHPRLGVFKLASCDGCQVVLLNLDRDLLALAGRLDVAFFPEATSRKDDGPFDVALVEGSVSTAADLERIRRIRSRSRVLVTIGACATAGGIQALRNGASLEAWKARVYPQPEWVEALATSTPISDHVRVDAEIHGCPVNGEQVLRVLLRELVGAGPDLPSESVCIECKRRGNVCVTVAKGIPCMGPVTRAGCGALCPSLGRDCYACFGPAQDPNLEALIAMFRAQGLSHHQVEQRVRGIAGHAPAFRRMADHLAGREPGGRDG